VYICNVTKCLYSEAEYAFTKHKPTVAVRLEADYEPDGWLGPLCLINLFYDFSDPQNLDEEWRKLHAKLTEMTAGSSSTTGSSSVSGTFDPNFDRTTAAQSALEHLSHQRN